MFGFHPVDLAIALLYIAAVFYFGIRGARHSSKDQEGFFLAGRKLGKVYQFFLNFGNSVDANGAVSSTSLVYQQGVSGVWHGFQMIFLNPYYWFMNVWFRRVRLVTTADLFVDRLGSMGLARFYALFQCLSAAIIIIGFGNLTTYKISTALVVKDESAWTAAERASVEGYRELQHFDERLRSAPLSSLSKAEIARVATLRDLDARGQLQSTVSPLHPVTFYIVYSLVVCAYVVVGGMAALVTAEILQGFLIIIFSGMLIPIGIHTLGGMETFSSRIPAEFFELLRDDGSTRRTTALVLLGIFATTITQINGIPGNMSIYGSAKNEFTARFGGASGTFAKRLLIIMWAFCGLVAVALYQGPAALSDPDEAWGTMSRELLGPGLLGLMIVGVLAANMDTVAAQSMAVAAMFVRNIYQPLRPQAGEGECITISRITIVVAMALGIVAALSMDDVFLMIQFMLTVNVPFGATVVLMFFWRRLTVKAVWWAVGLSVLLTTLGPALLPRIDAVRTAPALLTRVDDGAGRLRPVYFEAIVRTDINDPKSTLQGRDRLHVELCLLKLAGVPVEAMSPSNQFAARLLVDALLPFFLLITLSLVTRPPDKPRVDQFFGKMKTPVGETPEAEVEAVAATVAAPHRFDHLKLFPDSNWEFTRWNRVDTVGFFVCCAISGGIIALFWGLLRLAAP